MRSGKARNKLLVLFTVVILGLLLVEVGIRIRQYVKYGTTETTYYRFAEDPGSGLTIPEPGSSVGPIEVNSLGFRGPEIKDPKPDGRIRIAFLGGSTTFCAEASSFAATWPQQVIQELHRRFPEASFDGINAGVGGYSTRESLINLQHRVARFDPDVLIIYHGTNDLTQDSRTIAEEQGIFEQRESETSPIGEYWMTWFLVEKNLRARFTKRDSARVDLEPAELASTFEERLRTLIDACGEVAPVTAIGTFCHRARREQTPAERNAACASSFYYMPYMTAELLLDCLEAYNEVVRRVAEEKGAIRFELATLVPADDEHFNDSVHMKDPGLAIVGQCVVQALVKSPEFLALLEGEESP